MGLVREGLSALRNDHLSKKKKIIIIFYQEMSFENVGS